MSTGTSDRITEVLAKAWLICDPNRVCDDPDEPDFSHFAPPHELAGKPRWHWFTELSEWRTSLGLTQFEAARLLDVPGTTYKGWESGRPVHRPHILMLALEQLKRTKGL